MRKTWVYTKLLPGWGGPTLCCPSPPVQRVSMSNIVKGLIAYRTEGRTIYCKGFTKLAAHVLGLEKGSTTPSPLGQVWCALHDRGVQIGNPDCAVSRYLLAATLLARDGLPTLALLASGDVNYVPVEQLAERTSYFINVALERGVVARRARTASLRLSWSASQKLLFRFGLLADLGLAKARAYRRQLRLTPEGYRLGREIEMAIQFAPPEQLNQFHLQRISWLARLPDRRGSWVSSDQFPSGEQSLYEACIRVHNGGPGTSWEPRTCGTKRSFW